MASRKSSASFPKTANVDATNSSDVLVFTGARPVQPSRQPHLPPPIERQKDEGFARFLKKHASPTHNRVTAGGRIVPIEPRSPPPFAISANAANCPQTQSTGPSSQEPAKGNADLPWTMNTPFSRCFGAGEMGSVIGNGNFFHNTSLQNGAGQSQTPYGSSNLASSLSPERMPLQSQLVGGPVVPPATYGQQITMLNGMQNSMSNFGFGGSMVEPYLSESVTDYNQQMAPSFATHQMPTPFQTLLAWEQHYGQLDQQLKDIDRHRAMSSLDPRLAEQRRVIVQQRSDAKDTVRELQALLGVRRRLESSQDSWNPSFNVDAPVYIPQNAPVAQASLGHRPSFNVNYAGIIEKPRGHGQCRAIPIIPPPKQDQQARSLNPSGEGSLTSEKWTSRSDNSIPQLEPRSSASSEQLQPSIMMKDDRSQVGSHRSSPIHTNTRSDQQSSSANVSQELAVVYSANDMPPGSITEEYIVVIEAINRPKGTISKVRLLDNRVIDVEGQGLGLMSSPTAGTYPTMEELSSTTDSNLDGHTVLLNDGRKCSTPLSQYNPNVPMDKENVSITPKGHQKAATDAFLAQYNSVNDNLALGVRPETQSLRTASNSQLRQYEQNTAQYYQRGLRVLASRENTRQPRHQTSASENKHGLAYSVADEKVFESGEADYVESNVLNTKGYSVTGVQNVHAIRSLPNSFNGAVEARQSFQAQLSAASKSRSPRFLRRFGANGGA